MLLCGDRGGGMMLLVLLLEDACRGGRLGYDDRGRLWG